MSVRARAALILVLGIVPGLPIAAEGSQAPSSSAIVNSGHRGAVLDIAFNDAQNLLFSVGEDGTMRLWNASAPALVRSLAVTHLKARMLAVNPSRSQAAFVATDDIGVFSLEVWDWKTGTRLYRLPLREQPLFVRYSSSGDYLMYGETRSNGPSIVRASDGAPAALSTGTRGMTGFAELSRTEKTLMTYELDGRIAYWDAASGRDLKDVTSVPLLTDIRMTGDRRYILGRTTRGLACVDVLTGIPLLDASVSGLVSADISPAGDEIVGVKSDGSLLRWRRDGDSYRQEEVPRFGSWQPVLARFGPDGLVLAGSEGEIDIVGSDGREMPVARDVLAKVSGIAAVGSTIAIATPAVVRVLDLQGEGAPVETFKAPNPIAGPTGLQFISPTELLLWKKGDAPGETGILDTTRGAFRRLGEKTSSPLVFARADAGRIFILEEDGTIEIVTMATGAVEFRSRVPGAVAFSRLSGNFLVVGQGPQGVLQGSLVRINSRTGETVALATPNVFTYALFFDPGRNRLYSLGVDADGFTNLVSSQGPGFEKSSFIERAQGEFLSAGLAFDEEGGILYSTIGREEVIAWKGDASAALPLSARAATALAAGDGILGLLNKDSSVTVWDAAAGRPRAKLSLFADGGWAAVQPDGSFSGSANAGSRVSVFIGGNTTPEPRSAEEARAP